jgi:hypothetical protein
LAMSTNHGALFHFLLVTSENFFYSLFPNCALNKKDYFLSVDLSVRLELK